MAKELEARNTSVSEAEGQATLKIRLSTLQVWPGQGVTQARK